MMIFDSFPSGRKAAEFAGAVSRKYGEMGIYCASEAEAKAIAPFRGRLDPPIVLIARRDSSEQEETDIQLLVEEFDGVFAGVAERNGCEPPI